MIAHVVVERKLEKQVWEELAKCSTGGTMTTLGLVL